MDRACCNWQHALSIMVGTRIFLAFCPREAYNIIKKKKEEIP